MNTVISHILSKNGLIWLIYYAANGLHISHIIPDRLYLKMLYRCMTGQRLNLKRPLTFNEKLQWLKLNMRDSRLTILVDKYKVKEYVSNVIGREHVIPLLGVWDRFDDIDFSMLPDRFVLKCSHDCGGLVICKDRNSFDKVSAKRKLESSLKKNYYWNGREWPYKNVNSVIFAEQYYEDSNHELNDYKFFCFNGKVKCFKIDFDRFTNHHANYYDAEGNILPFGEVICPPEYNRKLIIPKNIDEMIRLAEQIADSMPFARVDFYNVDGRIFFGEITLYPAGGMGKFTSKEWEYELGSWIELPINSI